MSTQESALDLASLSAAPEQLFERCDDCGDPFTDDDEWDDRHDIDGIPYHAGCCPNCHGGQCDGCLEALPGCVEPDENGCRWCSVDCAEIAADMRARDREAFHRERT